jgi:hypothetical protein
VAGLITLTVSSRELSTKTGVAMPELAGDETGADAGAAGWAAAGKQTINKPVRAHSRGAAKQAKTFTKTVFLRATG